MMLAIVLLAILFLIGFINTFFYIPPNKLLAHFQSLLSYNSSLSTISTKTTIVPPKEENKKKMKNTHERIELEKVFATFDKNGDGFITKQELGESLKNIGLFSSDKEVTSMIEKLDINGDGLIDIEEFCEMYESIGRRKEDGEEGVKEEEEEEEEEVVLKDAFDVFDGDRDGLISVEELGSVLSSLGLKKGIKIDDCKEMIRKVDMDGDGMVNFDEFKQMMKAGGKLISVS